MKREGYREPRRAVSRRGQAVSANAEGLRWPAVGNVSSNLINIEALTKKYGKGEREVWALDNVNLAVDDQEVVALLGPSGCGKSTLLKMVAGLYPPTSGEIRLDGKVVDGPSDLTGLMFQTPLLFPWLTLLDNVLLPIRIRGASAKSHRGKALEYIELTGLSGFADRYPWELSGGMQQRAAICRMLMNDPSVLLLDEPFGAVDEFTREYLDVEIMSIIRQERRTAIFVTHSVSEAVFVADRVIVMSPRPGRVAGDVTVDLGPDRSSDLFSSELLLSNARTVRQVLDKARGEKES